VGCSLKVILAFSVNFFQFRQQLIAIYLDHVPEEDLFLSDYKVILSTYFPAGYLLIWQPNNHQGALTPILPNPLLLRQLGLTVRDYCLGSIEILDIYDFILSSLCVLQISRV
jgi:hypothetical protein